MRDMLSDWGWKEDDGSLLDISRFRNDDQLDREVLAQEFLKDREFVHDFIRAYTICLLNETTLPLRKKSKKSKFSLSFGFGIGIGGGSRSRGEIGASKDLGDSDEKSSSRSVKPPSGLPPGLNTNFQKVLDYCDAPNRNYNTF